MIIGIDIDGVLAEFQNTYADVLIEVSGRDLIPCRPWVPTEWNWDKTLGYTKDEIGAAWEVIKSEEDFWLSLPEYPGIDSFVKLIEEELNPNIDVYFITSRPGLGAKLSTEAWLLGVGFSNPTVLISDYKAKSCEALSITHYIDDKNENCQSVYDQACSKVFMCERPWNLAISGVPRGTLDQFGDMIRAAV